MAGADPELSSKLQLTLLMNPAVGCNESYCTAHCLNEQLWL